MLSDRCLSVLLVTLVYCGQMVGCMKMKLGMEVELGPDHIVSDGDPAHPSASSPQKGGHRSPHFSAHICCGQMVAHLSNC